MTGDVAVETLHTMGCAGWRVARDRVPAAARREGISLTLTETVVSSLEGAPRRRFPGSPTVLVEGADVPGQGQARGGPCRRLSLR
ncbi:MAG: thioredoxin family protein [Thermoleophilia bacterium]